MAGEPQRVKEGESIEDDVRTILSNMQYKEKEIWQKRLFLMGLADTDSLEQKGKLPPGKPDFMPESFLRKDDVFYEDVKKIVEKGFGINHDETEQHTSHDYVGFHSLRHMSRVVLGLFDDFTNNGLYCLAKVLTEDSFSFEKTRPQMEKVIRKNLDFLQSIQCPSNLAEIQSQVSQLLGNQKNFRHPVKHLNVTLKCHRDVIMKVLDRLGDMPTLALSAMYRKLKVVCGYVPQLCPRRSGWSRDRLIQRVRMLCLEMIGHLGDSDALPEPLAKAMAVACLSSKLATGFPDVSLVRFTRFTPELEVVQNEIFKAIRLLGERIKKGKIKKVQHLLDPESTMDSKGVKSAIKNMLIEFLYECCDMDTIPNSLLDALSVINETSSRRVFPKEVIEEQVEEILNMSAAIKQILLDHTRGDKFDEDFADAYMEELVESDDGDIFDDDDDEEEEEEEFLTDDIHGVQIKLNDFNEEVQSTRDPEVGSCSSSLGDSSSSSSGAAKLLSDDECMDTEPSASKMLFSTSSGKGLSPRDMPMLDCDDVERQDVVRGKSVDSNSHSGSSYLDRNPMSKDDKKSRIQYVAIQEVSDQASLALYRLMGQTMEELAKLEGLDLSSDDVSYLTGDSSGPEHSEYTAADPNGRRVSSAEGERLSDAIIRAILKVMPSFPSAELEKIDKFLNL